MLEVSLNEESLNELERIFLDYRRELEECAKKHKPTDGLFGFGHSLKDDACHEELDKKLKAFVGGLAGDLTPTAAREVIRRLYTESDRYEYPLSAKWMLIACERYILALIPALTREDAAALLAEYAKRYRPWNRLPAQKEVCAELKKKAKN